MAERFEVIVVGAGFAGLHMLWKLRQMGLSTLVVEKAEDVGGTWYWNRYPGARVDVPSLDYSIPWDPDVDQTWDWTERYATQPELLDYVNHLADKHDLRRDIRFGTTLNSASWDDERKLWIVGTDRGDRLECRLLISGAGALSEPNIPDYPGIHDFKGQIFHTGRWPKEPVSLKGKRVAVMGTGSTGIQASTAISKQAAHLYVLQRTAQFSLPCTSPAMTAEELAERRANYPAFREWQRNHRIASTIRMQQLPEGLPFGLRAMDDPKEVRWANYEKCWNVGDPALMGVYADIMVDPEAAKDVSDFVRSKIRAIVRDPQTAESLCPPEDNYMGVRRIIMDTGYYQAFNQDNVTLVDLRKDPIVEIAEDGVRTQNNFYPIDVLVIATGYDAVTGPLVAMNITGRNGVALAESWSHGPHNYLGLMVAGFPNMFTITGPSSPGVLANVIYSIDQHVNWIADCIDYMVQQGATAIDTTPEAEAEWNEHALSTVRHTLRFNDKNNWYLGTNVPGKPRAVLVYQGGLDAYRKRCDEVARNGYAGFVFDYEKQQA